MVALSQLPQIVESRVSFYCLESSEFRNTIWSKVNWNGILTKSFKIFLVSEASLWKSAPGTHSGTYFTDSEQVGGYLSQYQEREVDVQREIKSTRYAPGSLNFEKRAIADSARVMIGSSFSWAS